MLVINSGMIMNSVSQRNLFGPYVIQDIKKNKEEILNTSSSEKVSTNVMRLHSSPPPARDMLNQVEAIMIYGRLSKNTTDILSGSNITRDSRTGYENLYHWDKNGDGTNDFPVYVWSGSGDDPIYSWFVDYPDFDYPLYTSRSPITDYPSDAEITAFKNGKLPTGIVIIDSSEIQDGIDNFVGTDVSLTKNLSHTPADTAIVSNHPTEDAVFYKKDPMDPTRGIKYTAWGFPYSGETSPIFSWKIGDSDTDSFTIYTDLDPEDSYPSDAQIQRFLDRKGSSFSVDPIYESIPVLNTSARKSYSPSEIDAYIGTLRISYETVTHSGVDTFNNGGNPFHNWTNGDGDGISYKIFLDEDNNKYYQWLLPNSMDSEGNYILYYTNKDPVINYPTSAEQTAYTTRYNAGIPIVITNSEASTYLSGKSASTTYSASGDVQALDGEAGVFYLENDDGEQFRFRVWDITINSESRRYYSWNIGTAGNNIEIYSDQDPSNDSNLLSSEEQTRFFTRTSTSGITFTNLYLQPPVNIVRIAYNAKEFKAYGHPISLSSESVTHPDVTTTTLGGINIHRWTNSDGDTIQYNILLDSDNNKYYLWSLPGETDSDGNNIQYYTNKDPVIHYPTDEEITAYLARYNAGIPIVMQSSEAVTYLTGKSASTTYSASGDVQALAGETGVFYLENDNGEQFRFKVWDVTIDSESHRYYSWDIGTSGNKREIYSDQDPSNDSNLLSDAEKTRFLTRTGITGVVFNNLYVSYSTSSPPPSNNNNAPNVPPPPLERIRNIMHPQEIAIYYGALTQPSSNTVSHASVTYDAATKQHTWTRSDSTTFQYSVWLDSNSNTFYKFTLPDVTDSDGNNIEIYSYEDPVINFPSSSEITEFVNLYNAGIANESLSIVVGEAKYNAYVSTNAAASTTYVLPDNVTVHADGTVGKYTYTRTDGATLDYHVYDISGDIRPNRFYSFFIGDEGNNIKIFSSIDPSVSLPTKAELTDFLVRAEITSFENIEAYFILNISVPQDIRSNVPSHTIPDQYIDIDDLTVFIGEAYKPTYINVGNIVTGEFVDISTTNKEYYKSKNPSITNVSDLPVHPEALKGYSYQQAAVNALQQDLVKDILRERLKQKFK